MQKSKAVMYVDASEHFSIFGVVCEHKLSRKIIQLYTYITMICEEVNEKKRADNQIY
jgi:hypothetical protein